MIAHGLGGRPQIPPHTTSRVNEIKTKNSHGETSTSFGAAHFLFSGATIYIALKHGNFLDWASGLTQPWSELMTVLIWITTAIGYVNLIIWTFLLLFLFIATLVVALEVVS